MIETIKNQLLEIGCDVTISACGGVYDTIIKVKYGPDAHDVGWVYMKDEKLLLVHIGDTNFPDIDSFILKLKELKK